MIFWGIVSVAFLFEGGLKGLGWRGERKEGCGHRMNKIENL